jgi:hypothetical protein
MTGLQPPSFYRLNATTGEIDSSNEFKKRIDAGFFLAHWDGSSCRLLLFESWHLPVPAHY